MAIVTLTSDFGTSDGYVGAMKGVILSRAPGVHIVDIAHDVAPCDIAHGAYCLRQAAPWFPAGTIHVVVVDPGVGTSRRAVIADDGHMRFIGPDNGVLRLAVPAPRAVYAIEAPALMRAERSATFHGRDVFAAAAGYLAAGGQPGDAGPEVELSPLVMPAPTRPGLTVAGPGERLATIVYVDRFGNLITDAAAAQVPAGARVRVGDRVVDRMSNTFGDVEIGALVAYIGSAGTLEVAIRESSAAHALDVSAGDAVAIAKIETADTP